MTDLAVKRHAPDTTQQQLASLVDSTKAEINSLTEQFGSGLLDATDFAESLGEVLEKAHAHAAYLGRLRAGDTAPFNHDDRLFAQAVMHDEAAYLETFEKALADGRYVGKDGLPDVGAIQQRAESYTGRMQGTANETWVLAGTEDAMYHWRLGGVEQHCPDCPERAQGGPYSLSDLEQMGYPRTNATACVFNCKCFLVRDDDETGFRAMES